MQLNGRNGCMLAFGQVLLLAGTVLGIFCTHSRSWLHYSSPVDCNAPPDDQNRRSVEMVRGLQLICTLEKLPEAPGSLEQQPSVSCASLIGRGNHRVVENPLARQTLNASRKWTFICVIAAYVVGAVGTAISLTIALLQCHWRWKWLSPWGSFLLFCSGFLALASVLTYVVGMISFHHTLEQERGAYGTGLPAVYADSCDAYKSRLQETLGSAYWLGWLACLLRLLGSMLNLLVVYNVPPVQELILD